MGSGESGHFRSNGEGGGQVRSSSLNAPQGHLLVRRHGVVLPPNDAGGGPDWFNKPRAGLDSRQQGGLVPAVWVGGLMQGSLGCHRGSGTRPQQWDVWAL